MAEDRTDEDEELVEIDEEESEVEDTEDGGALVTLDDGVENAQKSEEHFANIIEEVDQRELSRLVSDLLDKIEMDKEARQRRDELYEEGLKRTGMGNDSPGGAQFSGATKIVHPMLIQSCVDFSARVMKEIFPPGGPVKSKIFGKIDKEKTDKAERKTDFMNWQMTQQIKGLRAEHEQLTTQIPLGGVQYMKWYWGGTVRRPCAEFIPVDDIFIPFAATNFYTAERKTHRQYVTAQEFERRVDIGMYRDLVLVSSPEPDFSKASKANDKIEGKKSSPYNEDGLRTVYEISLMCDIEGDGMRPYIISIDDNMQRGLNLYRNWDPKDENYEELMWIVEFPMIPWRGAMAIGLTHMIGGLTAAATGSLRALMDSAHIQNIPTALKLKGGPMSQTITLQPTQIAELEGGPMQDDIRKLVMPLPFPGPSPTLFQLLGFLVDAGRGVVQTSFESLADQNANAPVGTTLALIEQGMVVFSSIHARMHNAMAESLKILHRINSSYLTEEDIKKAGDFEVTPADFDGPVDVVPVSDPQVFSEAQRFAKVQAILQRADAKPQLYDPRKVEAMFLRQLKQDEDILVSGGEMENMDPASENMAAVMGAPIFVLPTQNHIAHLMVHVPFTMSPVFGANPAMAPTFAPAMIKHLRDHVLQYYVTESHRAVDDATKDKLIKPDDAKEQARLINLVQEEAEPIMLKVSQLIAHMQSTLPQMPAPNAPPDTSLAVASINATVKREALQQDAQKAQQAAQIKMQELQAEQAQKAQDAQIEQMKIMQQEQARAQLAQYEQQQENMRTAEEMATRERMNTADNTTALQLAEAEIESGNRVAVSTGTGINPGP